MKVRKSIDIAAPPATVWLFLVEPKNALRWYTTLKEFKYTGDQRRGTDTTFFFKKKILFKLLKLNFEIIEWIEGERISFRMTSGNILKSYKQTWALKVFTTGTKFTYEEDIEFPLGIIGKILGIVARFSSQINTHRMLVKLKRLAEQREREIII